MFWRSRYEASRRACGTISFFRMLGGGLQYGRKMMYSIWSTNTGVACPSDLPTTTFMRSGSSGFSGS